MNLVVDANVAFKWLAKEDGSDVALQLLNDHDIAAPDLLLAECRNGLLTGVRRKRLTVEDARHIERNLDAIRITILPSRLFFSQAFALALDCDHPIYDCLYMAAAMSSGRTLVTADKKFAAKMENSPATRQHVRLLQTFAANA